MCYFQVLRVPNRIDRIILSSGIRFGPQISMKFKLLIQQTMVAKYRKLSYISFVLDITDQQASIQQKSYTITVDFFVQIQYLVLFGYISLQFYLRNTCLRWVMLKRAQFKAACDAEPRMSFLKLRAQKKHLNFAAFIR